MQTPEARKSSNARYFQKTKEAQRAKRLEWKRDFYKWYAGLKSGPCTDCNKKYPPRVMQFDHVRGKKVIAVAEAAVRNNRALVLQEVAKCDLVCANCHALRH